MSTQAKKTILLVEDEVIIALAEAQTIENFGYKVLMARSGEKAVEIAAGNEKPDLILMDIDLGRGISGPEAATQILSKNTIPVVFLTSHSEREMVEKVRGITRYGYVIKNSGDFVLQSSIEMAFELFEAHGKQQDEFAERKRAEEKIREKDLQFGKLSSHVPDMIYQFTRRPDGSYFVPIASVGIKNIFGCSPEDVLEDFAPIGRVIFPEDAARVIDDIEYSAKHLTSFTCEFRVQIPGKAIQWILSRSTPEQLPDGSVTWYGFNADITEHKRTEERQLKVQHLLASSQRLAHIGSWETELPSGKLSWSDEMYHILGFPDTSPMYLDMALSVFPPDELARFKEAIASALRGETPYNMNYTIMRHDGQIRIVHDEGEVIFDEHGKAMRMLGITQDVTERRKVEDAMQRSQAMLARTERIVHIGSWEWEVATDTVTWSDELFHIFQRNPREGAPSFAEQPAFFHPDDMVSLQKAVEGAIAGGTPYELELRAIRKDGETRMCVARGIVETGPDGRTARLFGSLHDITERKRTEQAIQANEHKFRMLFEHITEGVALHEMIYDEGGFDKDYRILEVNSAYQKHTGIVPESARGSLASALYGTAPPPFLEEYGNVARTGEPYSFDTHFAPMKRHFRILVFSPKRGLFATVFDDITDRKRAEERLKDERNLMSTLINAIPDEIAVKDLERRFVLVNHSCVRALGKESIDEVLGKKDEDLMPKEFADINILEEDLVLSTGKPILNTEGKPRLDPITGEVKRVLLMSRSPIRDEHGTVTGLVVVNRDITDRKQAEKHIEEIITKNPMSIQILDKDGFTLEVNNAFRSLFGSVPPPGYSIFEDNQFAQQGLSEVFDKLRTGEIVRFPDVCFNPHDSISELQDASVWTRTIGFPLNDSNGKPETFVLMHENITDRKKAEEQLHEMSKRLQFAAASAKAGVWDWNLKTGEMIWDERMYELYGLTHENFPGGVQAWEQGLHPDDSSKAIEECQTALRGEREFDTQFRVRHPDGTVLYIKANALVLRDEVGNPVRMIGLNTDITGRKLAEMKIESLLAEREVLLKEVHHRIKNNMNTMMSLLSLQAKSMTDPGSIEALNDARRRMQSMMVLYDKLYRSEAFSELSMNTYLVPLVHEIIANCPNNDIITIETDVEDVILDVRLLSPLGMIVNELITNMMKHAFTGRDKGVISVRGWLKEDHVTIVVQDNGIGLPEGFDLKTSSGFGLRLVDMLTEQIGGSMRIEREHGTRFILESDV